MVFFVRHSLTSITILTISFIVVALLPMSIAMAGAGPHYPDCEVKIISDEHIILKYNPQLSDDLNTVGRTCLYPVDGREVLGRVVLMAVPSDGEISYSVNFSRAGSTTPTATEKYISASTPLVMRGTAFDARGHRLVRLVIFPQRMENGSLAVYKDFVIDIFLTGSNRTVDLSPRLTRLDTVLAGSVINPGQFYRFGAAPRQQILRKESAGSFDDRHDWIRIAVNENGVTRINGSALAAAGLNLTDLSSDSIRLYYAGGKTAPESLAEPQPELYQVTIKVEDGGDGKFGSGDHLLFYAQAPDRFEFDVQTLVYVKNSYNDENYYWFTTGSLAGDGPERWSIIDGGLNGTPNLIVSSARHMMRIEQENLSKIEGDGRVRNYFDWFWSDEREETIALNLPNLVPGDSIDIFMEAFSSYGSSTISINGTPMNKAMIDNTYFRFWDNTGAAVSGLNNLRINLYHVSGQYLDYLDIDYQMYLKTSGPQITFNSRGYSGIVRYSVTGYTPSHYVLNITDPDSVSLVSDVEIMSDTARFQRPESSARVSRYLIYSSNSLLSPAAVEAIDPGNLRQDLTQYDQIVIAPQKFIGAMAEYAVYRYENGEYRIKLVAVEDIYNGFGYGMLSPMAIRNYLKFAYENYNDPAPFSVLLVGDGCYDFLNNTGHNAVSYIPPFIWSQEYSAGDDNYVYFDTLNLLDSDSSYIYESDRGWDMMVARWPVRTKAEIAAHIEAIRNYESSTSQGNWRTRITYVADDEFKGQITNEIIHTAMAETLAVFHTPPEFIHQKIYATDYPFASNGEKPTVNNAVVKAINDGTLILNYIGHGSPDVWADEHILKKSVDLGRMNNEDKLAVVIAGSCSIGFFDDPAKEGMAEILFRQQGGAIETVSATRLVYATDNAIFNYDLYEALFGNNCNVSEAVYTAKVMHQYNFDRSLIKNDRTYVVFGDPLGRFGLPEYRLQFNLTSDSVLTPLDYFSFSGTVTDLDGNPKAVSGEIEITAFDSHIMRNHELGISYSLGGPAIFRGTVVVESGSFEGGFIVPLDIDYGADAAYLIGYGAFGATSAMGGVDSLSIALSAVSTEDNNGPEINYLVEDIPDFVSGDQVSSNATVILQLNDESGINLTGGMGHRIELVIDDDNNSTMNLTDEFSYNSGSYRDGELQFSLPDLTPELHRFKIRAWDNANNPATVEFEATPTQESRIALYDVMNYPNPMEESTEFFFNLTESAEWVELQIFTLAGRMIKDFRADNLSMGKNRRFNWDGRDLDGDRIAQGVYLYKITAKGRLAANTGSADNMAEVFGKLILLN